MERIPERALGVHRVLDPPGVLPQAAHRLDPSPEIGPDEVRIAVERLNLDAASFRQLSEACGGDGDAVRAAVLGIVRERGKMQNPVTGSGGMLIGTVDAVGSGSPLGLAAGQRVATLVSLTLTPLRITDDLRRWDGRSEQVPAEGTAILFARSIAAALPDDLPDAVALAVLDVCGAPAATARVVERAGARSVTVLGAAGKSGCLSLAAARAAGATRLTGLVRDGAEAAALTAAGLADRVVVADATDPLAVLAAVGGPADVTVVCVDAPGAEHGAVLATAGGGTVVFFSMATSFSAAALGAEGMAADVTMLVGNGYAPGHADLALDLYRRTPGVRSLIDPRVRSASAGDPGVR
ncbi:L-erythro-3,5-diaminohexanoate dehydrogenase [Geodermatophilus sp. YIM 151500]|uniref:L-erythro-3,5-diaminohexanoate dehydrogenase n=1 Tax=Geodermatophilus sp. YIM 151500 TaxID=2984531 RepID=UPI0021E3963D|nr:L-erythro-3,5-diaminohexanoate dehydrogenase [Geodermatophilus sp. YIM 151500]MCV2489100.1 L-erythro-3,5-diaminohexanoate dehydrogenase [Geodermatophilus sp. YIM 151500]